MEQGYPVPPSHTPVLDHHPPQEPTNVGDEEEHHEKKSMFSKVQNKVKKLKNNFNKKRHANDDVAEVPVEEESDEEDDEHADMEVEQDSHSFPRDEPTTTSHVQHEPTVTPETINYGRQEPPVIPEIIESSRQESPDTPETNYGRQESPVTPETNYGRQESPDTPETNYGRQESPDTPETNYGRQEPPVTPQIIGSIQQESPVTPETIKAATAKEFDDTNNDMDVDSTLEYESPAAPRNLDGQREPPVTPETYDPHALDGQRELPITPETSKATTAEEPVAPLPYGSVPPTTDADTYTDADTNLPTSAGTTPGNESSVPPEVLSSLQAMSISEQREGQQRDQQPSETQPCPADETPISHMSSDIEKKPSYTEKLSSLVVDAKEAAVSAAPTAGTGSEPTGTPAESAEGEKKQSYTEKLSSTAVAAKDAAASAASSLYAMVAGKEEGTYSSVTRDQVVSPVRNVASTEEGAGEKGSYTSTAWAAASTVYGKVVGAGASVMGNVVEPELEPEPGQSKGGSVREYLAEKLRPGEEDKALCDVISGRGEEDKEVKGIIELPEVTSREVLSDAPAEAVSDAKGGGYTGKGMVEKIRGAVTSLAGGVAVAPAATVEAPSGGTADAPTAAGKGMVEKIRGAVTSLAGGVANAPAAAVEAPSGGTADAPTAAVEAPIGGGKKDEGLVD